MEKDVCSLKLLKRQYQSFFVQMVVTQEGAQIMTVASICRLRKEIQEIASSTYFGRPLSQLHKQHFESVMPISISPMFKQAAPRKGM